MKILVVAPHPYFQERGTPIAVKLLCESLVELDHEVDLLTFASGTNPSNAPYRIFRTPNIPFLREIPIGLSVKKLISDLFLVPALISKLLKRKYDAVHAGEESIFIAIATQFLHGLHISYDMDSSMADQIVEKDKRLTPVASFLQSMENTAFAEPSWVFAVCKSLGEKVKAHTGRSRVTLLQDVFSEEIIDFVEPIREGLSKGEQLILYVGNLESYQGIDLLLDSAELLIQQAGSSKWKIVVIGGNKNDIEYYQSLSFEKGLDDHVSFLGPRPFKNLSHYLKQADILVSPRLKGINTPMKLYAYLASGKTVVATKILSHTQAVDDTDCMLCEPNPIAMADALNAVLINDRLRQKLGENGKKLAYNNYSPKAYLKKLNQAYDSLAEIIKREKSRVLI